jgi:hypothetical protein
VFRAGQRRPVKGDSWKHADACASVPVSSNLQLPPFAGVPGCAVPSNRALSSCGIDAHAALQLASATVRLARAAIDILDLRQHAASHPRLGVVDHVSLQPAGSEATLAAAAEVAGAIGAQASRTVVLHSAMLSCHAKLDNNQCSHADNNPRAGFNPSTAAHTPRLEQSLAASGEVLASGPSAVPVILYGAAHPQSRTLQDLRRSLGYFRGASEGAASPCHPCVHDC